jgi:DNA polymerase III epsilon subunit-like protein
MNDDIVLVEDIHNLIFIDVETNGIGKFQPAQQRVVQLAWLLGDKKGSFFINDVSEVSPHVPHPYDVKFLKKNGMTFIEGMRMFQEDLKTSEGIVAHNAQFDIGCLLNELNLRIPNDGEEVFFNTIRKEIKSKPVIDTMLRTVNICKLEGKYGYKWPKLEELYFHLFHEKPKIILHDALNDCIVTRDCLNTLIINNMLNLN